MRHEDDVITVRFDQEGYKLLSRLAVTEGKLLTLATWRADAGPFRVRERPQDARVER